MTSIFSASQYAAAYPDGIENHWWSLARCRIVADVIADFGQQNAPVLEIGCGRGVVVKSLRQRGIQAFGVELADVQPMAGMSPYVTTAQDAVRLPEAQRHNFQSLLLLDVIEHMPDPEEFIRNVIAAFPNVTLLLVTVPAGQALWSNYDEYYGHYRRYSVPMLAQLGERIGWTTSMTDYFFHAVYLPARILALLGRKRQTRIIAPQGWQVALHKLLAWTFNTEYRLLPKSIGGTSAIACYRPPKTSPNWNH